MQDLFSNINALTVSELTKQIKITLEEGFSEVIVIGEISNFKAHISGHWYFNLKDSNAVISCAMWKGLNNYVFFTPQDGMKIIVSGRITVYPPRGSYQIDVRSMKPAGRRWEQEVARAAATATARAACCDPGQLSAPRGTASPGR